MARWLAGHSRTQPSKQAPEKLATSMLQPSPAAPCPFPFSPRTPLLLSPAASSQRKRLLHSPDRFSPACPPTLPARPIPSPDSLHPNWAYRRNTVTATSSTPTTPRCVEWSCTITPCFPTRSSVPVVANTPTANRGKRHRRSGREVSEPLLPGLPFRYLIPKAQEGPQTPAKPLARGAVRGEVLRLWRSDLLFASCSSALGCLISPSCSSHGRDQRWNQD